MEAAAPPAPRAAANDEDPEAVLLRAAVWEVCCRAASTASPIAADCGMTIPVDDTVNIAELIAHTRAAVS